MSAEDVASSHGIKDIGRLPNKTSWLAIIVSLVRHNPCIISSADMHINGISDMSQSFIERRKHPRKDMSLVMEIEKRNQPESRFCVVTSNISASGVYFKTLRGTHFTPDTEADFTLFLAAPVPNGKSCVNSLQGSGRVVRCENPDENTAQHEENNSRWSGIAIQFNNPLKIDSSSFSFR